jgi:hypothetical protein
MVNCGLRSEEEEEEPYFVVVQLTPHTYNILVLTHSRNSRLSLLLTIIDKAITEK